MGKIRAVAIMPHEGKIALIRRIKKGRQYYCFPGGGVEKGETPEAAAIREIKEEMNLDINLGPLLWDFSDEYHHGLYFLGKNPKGELKLGGPELFKQTQANKHIPEWVPLEKVPEIILYPEDIKKRVIEKFLLEKI
jgi:8-oxo-dGTP diphosphatase